MDLHRVLAELTDRIDQAVLGWEVSNLLSKSSSPYNISSRERIRWISCILNMLLWNSPNIYLTLGILDLGMYRWCGTKNQAIRFATLCFLSQLKKKQTPNQAFGNSPDQPTLLLLRTPHPLRWGVATNNLVLSFAWPETPTSRFHFDFYSSQGWYAGFLCTCKRSSRHDCERAEGKSESIVDIAQIVPLSLSCKGSVQQLNRKNTVLVIVCCMCTQCANYFLPMHEGMKRNTCSKDVRSPTLSPTAQNVLQVILIFFWKTIWRAANDIS